MAPSLCRHSTGCRHAARVAGSSVGLRSAGPGSGEQAGAAGQGKRSATGSAGEEAARSIMGGMDLSAPSAALMGCAGSEQSKPNEMLNKIKDRVK